jgi:hypothetical protein
MIGVDTRELKEIYVHIGSKMEKPCKAVIKSKI